MTNTEAIEEIRTMGLIIDAMTYGTRRKSIYEALNLAIKALEAYDKILPLLNPDIDAELALDKIREVMYD